jgi:hypothetical protein
MLFTPCGHEAHCRTGSAGNARHSCPYCRRGGVYSIFRDIYCIYRARFRIRQKDDVNACANLQLYFCAFGTLRTVLAWERRILAKLDGSRGIARLRGRPAMDLLNALLDLADAISAGVALATFWYTWVVPPDRRRLPAGSGSGPDELDQFIRAAVLIKPSSQGLG